MRWSNEDGYGVVIYDKFSRENNATKKLGFDLDYTAEEMDKLFRDLCKDFGYTIGEDGEVISPDKTLLCDEW